MEHNIIKPDKDFEPELKASKSEHKLSDKDEESDKTCLCWQAYTSSPSLMSVTDLSFAFNELKKMLQQWLEKRKKPIIYKNKSNETI